MLKRTLDRKIEIVAKNEASYSIILGDETQLESCLLNLAVNARDAMPSGGRLTFETTTTTLSAQKANRLRPSLPAGHYVCLKVSDTGQGVDPEIIDHIFEPFFSTKPTGEGTGLGLATSYGTIQEHGGHIRVESDAGTGTTFTILIPAHYDPTALQEDPATMPALVKGQGTVLLLDDDDTIREVAADMLRTLGYTVVSFASPVEALEWYRRKHADVDLVITDLIMPQIGGLGCFQEFKRIRPDLRAIVVSGYDRRQERERLLGEGAKAFLPKPFSIHTLSRAVAQAMRD
jgi:CheY-like chemotaxis protein